LISNGFDPLWRETVEATCRRTEEECRRREVGEGWTALPPPESYLKHRVLPGIFCKLSSRHLLGRVHCFTPSFRLRVRRRGCKRLKREPVTSAALQRRGPADTACNAGIWKPQLDGGSTYFCFTPYYCSQNSALPVKNSSTQKQEETFNFRHHYGAQSWFHPGFSSYLSF